jgi:hypothetical protein
MSLFFKYGFSTSGRARRVWVSCWEIEVELLNVSIQTAAPKKKSPAWGAESNFLALSYKIFQILDVIPEQLGQNQVFYVI